MKPILKPTLFLCLAALAVRSPASPITPADKAKEALLNHADSYGLRSLGWGIPHARPHQNAGKVVPLRPGADVHSILQGLEKDPWNGFKLHPGMCGGAPGAGVVHHLPDPDGAGPLASHDPEDEDVPDVLGSQTPDSHGEQGPANPSAPVVPEPGTLALMGSGLMGLLAARRFFKKA